MGDVDQGKGALPFQQEKEEGMDGRKKSKGGPDQSPPPSAFWEIRILRQTARHDGWAAPVFVMTICQSWMLLDRKAPAQDSR